MHITVSEQRDDRVVLTLTGDVDLSTAPTLRNEITRVVSDGHDDLILDLEGVPFLDSTGLGVLVGRLKAVRMLGGDMCLVTTQERTLRNFSITGLDKVFRIYSSVEEAVADATDVAAQ